MHPSKTFILSLALAATALTPAAALARNGADDSAKARDDNGQRPSRAKSGRHKAKRVTGKCTDGSTSKLKVKPDNERLETEFEVDQNRNGVTLEDDDPPQRRGRRQHARQDEGAQSLVQRRAAPRNGAGSDRIGARATAVGQVSTAPAPSDQTRTAIRPCSCRRAGRCNSAIVARPRARGATPGAALPAAADASSRRREIVSETHGGLCAVPRRSLVDRV